MARIRIIADRADGLSVEYDYDDVIIDTTGQQTIALLDRAACNVRSALSGLSGMPTESDAKTQ